MRKSKTYEHLNQTIDTTNPQNTLNCTFVNDIISPEMTIEDVAELYENMRRETILKQFEIYKYY